MERFRVEVVSQTSHPQQVIYAAMHQDYAEAFVWDERDRWPDEESAGELIIKHLLAGNRGHFGPLEHPQIVLNFGWFPHSTMQQLRTHRVGVSFDVQCLAGDTEVTFVDTSGAPYQLKISGLYDRWTQEDGTVRTRQIRVLNESTGIFETSYVQDVLCSGLQPVYRLTLADGKTLDCTTNHRLFTSQGWQTMKDAVGLVVDEDHQALAMTRACEVMCNGAPVAAYPEVKASPAETFWPRTQSTPGSNQSYSGESRLRAHPIKVIDVEFLGFQTTYDLEIQGEWHNFVANGLVVHNSFRYTGSRLLEVAEGKREVEDVFYLRPLGFYADRQGKKYEYTAEQRQQDIAWCLEACDRYKTRIEQGFSEEHARGLIPFDVRQHWVMSANVRSLMHILDLRAKGDAQLEIQQMCELIWPHFEAWVPAVAAWYKANRWKKARLSP